MVVIIMIIKTRSKATPHPTSFSARALRSARAAGMRPTQEALPWPRLERSLRLLALKRWMHLARRLLAVLYASAQLDFYLEAMNPHTAIRRRLRILSEHDPFSDPIGDPWQQVAAARDDEEPLQFPVAARKCSHRHPQHPVKAHGGTYATKECTACGTRWGLNHNTPRRPRCPSTSARRSQRTLPPDNRQHRSAPRRRVLRRHRRARQHRRKLLPFQRA